VSPHSHLRSYRLASSYDSPELGRQKGVPTQDLQKETVLTPKVKGESTATLVTLTQGWETATVFGCWKISMTHPLLDGQARLWLSHSLSRWRCLIWNSLPLPLPRHVSNTSVWKITWDSSHLAIHIWPWQGPALQFNQHIELISKLDLQSGPIYRNINC
jgi:hypothetical protein